ncbi:hypothetical protein BJF88_11315 [Cellulosimicrobium sp. CUA-896]|nr:hypothetical protein BJF88_11315 [Cellulosimicrobium sp. CUA-896]
MPGAHRVGGPVRRRVVHDHDVRPLRQALEVPQGAQELVAPVVGDDDDRGPPVGRRRVVGGRRDALRRPARRVPVRRPGARRARSRRSGAWGGP